MTTPFIIAIDGPAASGKGSLAKKIAAHLGLAHLDTGLIYRRVGLDVLKRGGDPNDEATARAAAQKIDADALDDPDLKSDEAGQAASQVGQFQSVRDALFAFQRGFADAHAVPGAVLDGRDIGTVICPDARVKLFVTAATEVRARRRFDELAARGTPAPYADVLDDMRRRDARDSGRSAAPLVAATDAHILDTSAMTLDEALKAALALISAKKSP